MKIILLYGLSSSTFQTLHSGLDTSVFNWCLTTTLRYYPHFAAKKTKDQRA